MRLRSTVIPLLGLCLSLGLAFVGCSGGTSPTTAAGDPRPDRAKPLVVATTSMVGDIVRAVGGDRVDLVILIQPGTDPHLWTPTRSDVLKVLEADAVFMSGLMLEGRAGESFSRVELSGRPVVRLAESLAKKDLLTDPANPSHFDPHVWMDPVLWAKTAPAVRDALAKLDPAGSAMFDKNLASFEADAAVLDRDCSLAVNSIPFAQRTLVTAHDAFGYFGRRYGLTVRGIQGISTESEPSLGDIERLVAEVSEKRIPAIFIETTVSDRTVRAVVDGCAAKGHELKIGDALYSDSLGRAGTPDGTWPGMLRHNAKSIANALGGRG
jgi:manganese/zinc/iron transport system substrate-binding protein